ncbi:MAG: sulfatase-like hydrolase/transferase, partial [Anaerolineales bacterium]|nr:sulfatase-like hydrolase/transferase [Anaerolineales bacterium]
MTHFVSRRDFLKLAALTSLSLSALPSRAANQLSLEKKQNILIVVFDALSAYHLSMYGYSRATTPNLAKLAERAIVYHNHFAGGNYTVTGAASLLTGALPWKHRAFRFNDGVSNEYVHKNIFSAFDESYYRIAYTHNPNVVRFLNQFADDITNYIPYEQFLISGSGLIQSIFKNDDDIANIGWSRNSVKTDGTSYSLFLSEIYKRINESKIEAFKKDFPRGIPATRDDDHFLLEDAIDFLSGEIVKIPQPFLGYFHFMPPHKPYTTHRDFYGAFANDDFKYIEKTQDPFAPVHSARFMLRQRAEYDEYILYLDREFGKFFESLESSGLLENTTVVFTSDHGELFERGIQGHITPSLYQPIVRIPLMIFQSDVKKRVDIYDKTSAVDLLPTLLHLAEQKSADWTDGAILPPFAPAPERNIYAVQAANTDPDSPLEQSTIM